jgi:cytochrome c oxidase assembly protein subunit 15
MRHEHRDLAIVDFPLAYGRVIPETTPEKLAEINEWRYARALSEVTSFHIWLQMAHRFVALVVTAGVIACLIWSLGSELRRRPLTGWAATWFFLLICQITLGAWVIWSDKAADIATAHVAVGAAMLAVGIIVAALSLRLSRSREAVLLESEYPISRNLPA